MLDSPSKEVRVSFSLEPGDVIAMRRFLLRRPRALLALVVLMAVVVVFLAIGDLSTAIVTAVFWFILILWFLYLQPRRSFRSNPSLNGERTWTLSPDGLSLEVRSAEGDRLMSSAYDWPSVEVRSSP